MKLIRNNDTAVPLETRQAVAASSKFYQMAEQLATFSPSGAVGQVAGVGRSPKMARPTRTMVAPSSIATG
jgi:hypothetical protein